EVLRRVCQCMQGNGDTFYGACNCRVNTSNYTALTPKGPKLFMHVYLWPGTTVTVAGLKTRGRTAKLLASHRSLIFQQDEFRIRFIRSPEQAPDQPLRHFGECESEPVQDNEFVRRQRSRTF